MDAKKKFNRSSEKEISNLFKGMLKMLEDMKMDHDFHYDKLYENIPEKYHSILRTADHFTPDKVNWIRKRILDLGNESIRNLVEETDNYTVSFVFTKD
tara:strand:+ start:375 stop:668 length:294 start_codon:yes stop_codon:yes gene_type:complete